MTQLFVSKLRAAARIMFALSVLLPLPAPAQGVTAAASGTYTWNAATGVVTFNWTSSDFTCLGPSLGTETNTVTVTATTMAWANEEGQWTRASGTAGDIVGAWTVSDGMTGNSWTATFDAIGTVSVTGIIVLCIDNGRGPNPSAESQRWPSGYYVQPRYNDQSRTANFVSATGPGITGSTVLAYYPDRGAWYVQLAPGGNGVYFGTPTPTGLPFTYTFTITDATGTRTANATVSCFQEQFVTNLSPAGSVYGTPTFSWTGIDDANARYGLELKDSNNNRIWSNSNVSGVSIGYSGPALASGTTYNYLVSVLSSSACNSGSSFAQGSFTYWASGGDVSAPAVPRSLNATAGSSTHMNLSWTASTDNVGVTGYKVYRNGVLIGNTAGTSYSDTGLNASTTYSYTVSACDAGPNCSAQSAAVSATTQQSAETNANQGSDCLFNWAERTYPAWFAPAGASSARALQYYFRYYSQTNAYLATSSPDNRVYYFGPLSSNTAVDVGALSGWLSTASCQ